MNGLEAIEFMKQGKMVISRHSCGDFIINKIVGNTVYYIYESSKDDDDWELDDCFDFTNTYEEYIEPKQLTGWGRVSEYDKYFSIQDNGEPFAYYDNFSEDDDCVYENANYFSTVEKAEEINFKQTLFRKLQRFSDENWDDNNQTKYCIVYDHSNQKIVVEVVIVSRTQLGQVYFSSFKTTQKAIELFHDDLIKYFTM